MVKKYESDKERKLRKLSERYRETGVYTKEMQKLEDEFVQDNISKFYKEYLKDKKKIDMSLVDYIGLQIGLWQAKYGFYLSYNHPKIKK